MGGKVLGGAIVCLDGLESERRPRAAVRGHGLRCSAAPEADLPAESRNTVSGPCGPLRAHARPGRSRCVGR